MLLTRPSSRAPSGARRVPPEDVALSMKTGIRRCLQRLFGGQHVLRAGGGSERLVEVGDDVVDVLDTDAQADHLRPHPGIALLLRRHLTMRGRGRVARQRLGVAHVHQALDQLERVVALLAAREPAMHPESHERAGAPVEVFLRERVMGAVGKGGIVDPGDARIVAQEFRHPPGILDMALDPQRHRLDPLQQQERAQRRQHRTGGALIDAAAARDIGGVAEVIGIHQAVIRRVRLAEHRETIGVLLPGEAAAVDDDPAHGGAVPAQKLGERVHDDVGAVRDRLQQDRGRDRIIDDERNAVGMRDIGQRRDVADVAGRVADALAEHRLGVLIDEAGDRVRLVRFRETHLHALARKQVSEQRVRGAVELRHRDDVAAERRDVERRVVQRRLARAHAKRFEAAFQRRHAPLQDRIGRIVDPCVAEALGLEVEQGRAMLGAVECIGDGLIDRHRHGLGRGIDLVAAMDGDRVASHLAGNVVLRLFLHGRSPRRPPRKFHPQNFHQ